MPNWCNTQYVIEGDKEELKSLYKLMEELQEQVKQSVTDNSFCFWLGNLVKEMGGDSQETYCRGEWSSLSLFDDTIRLLTCTAWSPCHEVFDLVCEKFPSLNYYYQSEEPGFEYYETNDAEGKYFPERFCVEINFEEECEFYSESFIKERPMLQWIEDIVEKPISSMDDVYRLNDEWKMREEDKYIGVYEYKII